MLDAATSMLRIIDTDDSLNNEITWYVRVIAVQAKRSFPSRPWVLAYFSLSALAVWARSIATRRPNSRPLPLSLGLRAQVAWCECRAFFVFFMCLKENQGCMPWKRNRCPVPDEFSSRKEKSRVFAPLTGR